MGSTPERARRAEDEARGRRVEDVDASELGRLATADLEAIPDDLHGSAAYRRRVGAVTVARAWAAAREEACRA
jgi:carbon-monoxide dehydrogenase medium subunit